LAPALGRANGKAARDLGRGGNVLKTTITSQTRDKGALTEDGVGRVIAELRTNVSYGGVEAICNKSRFNIGALDCSGEPAGELRKRHELPPVPSPD
jgi:hypothetical protein